MRLQDQPFEILQMTLERPGRVVKRLLGAACTVVVLVGWATGVGSQATGVHPLSGRRYAAPIDVRGAPWLERAEREDEERPTRALELIGVAPGSTVADVGAGSGYFTVRLSRLVGPAGKVYANDLQLGMLDLLSRRLARESITNVELVQGQPDDPRLPRGAIDLVLLVDVYHEFGNPQAMLRGIRAALKPGGRLVLLEYRGEDPAIPIRPEHKMTIAQARLEVEAEGFTLDDVKDELPWQHILVFRQR